MTPAPGFGLIALWFAVVLIHGLYRSSRDEGPR
jgi:hypothetical protein